MPQRPIIEIRNLHKSFGPLRVLDGVSLDIHAGQTTVILGPSGTGKSVLIKHVVGLLKPDAGEVLYRYRGGEVVNMTTLSERQLADVRRDFGFLFQMGALFDSMCAGDNVAFPLTEHKRKQLSREQVQLAAQQKLEMVGLAHHFDKLPSQLSGGQRKRVALARAIAMEPRIILYDEPTTGLDPITSDVINELIIKLQRELKVTSIVVTHDMVSAFKVADRIIMLHQGHVIADASTAEFRQLTDPRVQRFIAGRADDDDLQALRKTVPQQLDRSWFMDAAQSRGADRTAPPGVS